MDNLAKILIDGYGYSPEKLAVEVGASMRSVSGWYKGDRKPLKVFEENMLKVLDRLNKNRRSA